MAILRSFTWLSLFISTSALGQSVAFNLTDSLHEVSGMATNGRKVWFINDSGNGPLLFTYLGEQFIGIQWVDARNYDWESMTIDGSGDLYIGDMGDNDNNRQHREVYRISAEQIRGENDTLFPEKITFRIPADTPIAPANRHYDWESLIYYRGALHTFSKNRREPFNGEIIHFSALMYPEPDTIFRAVDTTHFGQLIREKYWITDACLSNDKRHLFLLTSDKVLGFLDFPDDSFFEGYRIEIPLNEISQKESIAAWNDTTLLVADEIHPLLGGGNVYTVHWAEYLNDYLRKRKDDVHIEESSIDSLLTIGVESDVRCKVYFELFNDGGQPVRTGELGAVQAEEEVGFDIDLSDLEPGVYILNVLTGRVPHGFFLIVRPRAEDYEKWGISAPSQP